MLKDRRFVKACVAAMIVALAALWPVLATSGKRKHSGISPSHAATMSKTIATAGQPAIVTVKKPSSQLLAEGASLQLTVRPEVVDRAEPYVVNVYMVPRGGSDEASMTGGEAANFLGSFSFFPPPRKGEVRAFVIESPDFPSGSGGKVTLKVELVPASPDAKLQNSALAIVDARIAD